MSEYNVKSRSRSSVGHDEVAAALASNILSGTFAPGSRMPSTEDLCQRFGVSRVMMREVFKTLTAKGMITGKSRIGTLVLPQSCWNWFDPDLLSWRVLIGLDNEFLQHLVQMRRAVEPATAALAATMRRSRHVDNMRIALQDMAQAGRDRQAFSDADLRFHVAIAVASGNPLFRSFASVIATVLRASLAITAPLDEKAMCMTIARHRAIADAVEAGNSAAAHQAMLIVINEGIERVNLTQD